MINAKYSARKRVVNSALEILTWIAGSSIAFIALIQNEQYSIAEHLPSKTHSAVAWLSEHAWWLIVILGLTAAVAKLLREKLDRDWKWTLIQELIDRIARDAFVGTDGPIHHHRATLFHRCWCFWITPFRSRCWPWGYGRWPWSGWLVPLVRSGYATQKSKTVFLAPDDADNAEGVAGMIWAYDKELIVTTNKAIGHTATQAEIDTYANNTVVASKWVGAQIVAGKVLAASFQGIPVEVKGRKWGVLLLDSRDPTAAAKANLNMSSHAYVLGKLLEGATL